MQTGTILRLNRDRQYGKIKADSGEDAHFHNGCLWATPFGSLTEGQQVEFVMQESYNGYLAFQIRPYKKTPEDGVQ